MSEDKVKDSEEEGIGRSFVRSAWIVGIITLLSRLTGLLRVNTQARLLGTGDSADAFRIALQIPNLFRRLVGEGAITSSFVPVLVDYHRNRSPESLKLLIEKLYTLWSVALILITSCGIFLALSLLILWGGVLEQMGRDAAWSEEKLELTSSLTQWLFPYLIFIGLSAIGQGVLNTYGKFGLPAATSVIYNFVFILAGLGLDALYPDEEAAWFFVVGVLGGGAAQFLILLPSLWKRGIRFIPRWPFGDKGVKEVLKLFIPGTFGAGVYQVNVLVSMMIAMSIPIQGAVASLDYSSRLMEFVLGVFVFALSIVGLTTLSRHVADENLPAVKTTTTQLLRLALFITLPSTVGLFVLGPAIIELLLQWGAFDARSSELTWRAFQCHLPGLIFVGLNRVMVSAFYAFKDIWIPVGFATVALGVNAILCWVLSQTQLEHAGIALASSASALTQSIGLILVFKLKRDLVDLKGVLSALVRGIVASAIMGGVCYYAWGFIPTEGGFWLQGGALMGTITLGALIYFAISRLLGAPEVDWLLGKLKRR